MGADAAEQIERLEGRLLVLSEALHAMAEATADYERLLVVIAQRLTQVVKDGCVVRLLSNDGWLAAAAIDLPIEAHVADGDAIARFRTHVAAPHHVDEQGAARRVLETGEALLVPRFDVDGMRSTSAPEVVQAYELIGIHSLLMVALRVRGESIGLLALVRFLPSSPPFDDHDRELAQALANHAALAISNARLLRSALAELAERERAEAALKKAEDQLRHAQKMEAVGRLAGGIAHDFNNLLSAILGFTHLARKSVRKDERLHQYLTDVYEAGQRAAELTQQLLAFSRRQVLEPRVVNLNDVLSGLEKILRRVVGADVEVTLLTAPDLANCLVDPSQMEQVVMNLVVNARDAMPRGGQITIETTNVLLNDQYVAQHLEASVGAHVMIAVSDTGLGMDKETQARIFEPFFTTKEAGKGTGLGLSTVFGIVKQSGGHIWVYSEPGQGTTFKVYLPRSREAGETVVVSRQDAVAPEVRGAETILLVEDDEKVRALCRIVLRQNGYHVLDTSNAGEALLVAERHGATIHLLLTDVVLPRMSGREFAERLRPLRPAMKVLYMSGYTENAIVHHGVLDAGINYLPKPILPDALLLKVRQVLDE